MNVVKMRVGFVSCGVRPCLLSVRVSRSVTIDGCSEIEFPRTGQPSLAATCLELARPPGTKVPGYPQVAANAAEYGPSIFSHLRSDDLSLVLINRFNLTDGSRFRN